MAGTSRRCQTPQFRNGNRVVTIYDQESIGGRDLDDGSFQADAGTRIRNKTTSMRTTNPNDVAAVGRFSGGDRGPQRPRCGAAATCAKIGMMTTRPMYPGSLVVLVMMLGAAPASAQDDRRFGLVAAYPGSAGLLWQVSDKFALRGDGSYSWSTTTSEPETGGFVVITPSLPPPLQFDGPRTETSSRAASIGVSALFDLHRREALRLYVAPRVAIAFSKSTTRITSVIPPEFERFFPQPRTRSSTSSAPTVAALFGGATKIGDRFGVFGEIGLAYSQSSPDNDILNVTSRALSTRGGIGAVLFF